ncbi:hypothetical protein [Marinimicrobium sp. ABcell2]|uniref:hypothetical protein n=1 Tax=Marinimicrobium sp. ABcell2 TaxID=3069751 RepID=UPI0027B37725|nr:hypothetical protein [Marinimicrobium sp. ABcell2]MDQ2078015.1 hypothetical protein [Marinimicrobium sp. ABcell2]
MSQETPQLNEAVLLFSGDAIDREMLYPEFEAILDGFVPMPEHAGSTAKGVYLRIDSQLCIVGAAFFLLDFDASGKASPHWNIPLEQMLSMAAKGPDLGAGPIKLVCFSQCPIEWQQKNLWDPQMDPGRNSFVLMRKAVKVNRLGLLVQETPASEKAAQDKSHRQLQQKLHQHYSQELRDRMAHMLREQRLRVTTLSSRQAKKVQKLQQEHQQRIQLYRDKIHQLQEQNEELTRRHQSLRENFDTQVQKIEGMREYFTHKLEAAHQGESSQLQALQENYEMELAARVQAAITELQERLDMREMELFYRHQQESNLKDEIARLQEENQSLLNQGGGHLLNKLSQAGINFVTFQPGAGHMTITLDDMGRYLNDPMAYAAEKCGVDADHYRQWLMHYQSPACCAVDSNGQGCGRPIARIDNPSDFHPGESDRCPVHQDVGQQRTAEQR